MVKKNKNFSNARYVRNLFEKTKIEQSYRVTMKSNENINLIKKCDIEKVIEGFKTNSANKVKIGFST